jgi:K+ transporter
MTCDPSVSEAIAWLGVAALAPGSGVELVLDKIYLALARIAADPTDLYYLPRDRVVKLGERVAI